VYDGQSSSSLLIATYTQGERHVDLISSKENMSVTLQSGSCGRNPVLSGSYSSTESGNLISILPYKDKKIRNTVISCRSDLKPNVERLLAFVRSEAPLIFAKIKMKYVGTGNRHDKIVVRLF
jgi:hypothetical protein